MNIYQADKCIRKYQELEKDRAKFIEIAEEEKTQIASRLEYQLKRIDEQQQDLANELRGFSELREDLKETKTQFKYESLSGNVIIKKDDVKLRKTNDIDLEEIKQSDFKHFITQEVQEKLNWADMKRLLTIKDNNIINTETGEVVKLKGLELEEVKGDVIIK